MNIDNLISELNKNQSHLYESFKSEIQKIYHYSDKESAESMRLIINLVREFKNTYPKYKDVSILRVPGRVNLIGEHLDYNGFPVLPIAIEKNVIIIFSKRKDNRIKLQNHDIRFLPKKFYLAKDTEPYTSGDWGNYIKAGALGLNLPNLDNLRGFNALVFGNIPIASGLSSSSAMVVASALTLFKVNEISFDKNDLADKLAKAEHYVGTIGGGMDQATILFGEEGKTLKIDFFPLSISSFEMPKGYSFIVANTCTKAAKTEKMKNEYNRRPLECKISAAIIKKHLEKKLNKKLDILRLGDLQKIPDIIEPLDQICSSILTEESYNIEKIVKLLGINRQKFINNFLTLKNGEIFQEPKDGFKLKQRTTYVFNEQKRVIDSTAFIGRKQMEKFGQLMYESQYEARDLYDISCPELDKMVEIAKGGGALGARLTGAGFGGCCIILIEKEKAAGLITHIKKEYYNHYLKNERAEIFNKIVNIKDQIFICNPSDGAKFLI